MIEEKVLICSLNIYSFPDKDTGELIEGATVWVMPLKSDDEYVNGSQPQKYSLKKNEVGGLDDLQLPVLADMLLSADISRKTLKLSGFDNFQDFKI